MTVRWIFASDVRANNVGDIITVTLEESMTAANSGSETTTKKDVTLLIYLKLCLVHLL